MMTVFCFPEGGARGALDENQEECVLFHANRIIIKAQTRKTQVPLEETSSLKSLRCSHPRLHLFDFPCRDPTQSECQGLRESRGMLMGGSSCTLVDKLHPLYLGQLLPLGPWGLFTERPSPRFTLCTCRAPRGQGRHAENQSVEPKEREESVTTGLFR